MTAFNATISPTNVTVVGNSIFGNEDNNTGTQSSGLGIDIFNSTDNEPDGVVDSDANVGVTANDSADADTGPNNFMNFPVLNNATQNGTTLTVDLNLDAADTTDSNGNYRVEFFANDSADTSGYGEGQTYLGSANISNGNNKTATVTLANGTNLTGKVLSATTTAINNTTASGFGATSEFSQTKPVAVLSTVTSNNPLANTGQYLLPASMASLVFVGSTSSFARQLVRRRLYRYSGRA